LSLSDQERDGPSIDDKDKAIHDRKSAEGHISGGLSSCSFSRISHLSNIILRGNNDYGTDSDVTSESGSQATSSSEGNSLEGSQSQTKTSWATRLAAQTIDNDGRGPSYDESQLKTDAAQRRLGAQPIETFLPLRPPTPSPPPTTTVNENNVRGITLQKSRSNTESVPAHLGFI